MSLGQRISELEKEVKDLHEKFSAVYDKIWDRTVIEYPLLQSDDICYDSVNNITVKGVVQMLLKHSGLQIKKTPEKISLEATNAEPLKDN